MRYFGGSAHCMVWWIRCWVSLWLRGSSFHGRKPLRDIHQIRHPSAYYTHILQFCSDYSVDFWISHLYTECLDKKPLSVSFVSCIRRLDLLFLRILINIWLDQIFSFISECKPSLRLRSPLCSNSGILQSWGFSTFWKS